MYRGCKQCERVREKGGSPTCSVYPKQKQKEENVETEKRPDIAGDSMGVLYASRLIDSIASLFVENTISFQRRGGRRE